MMTTLVYPNLMKSSLDRGGSYAQTMIADSIHSTTVALADGGRAPPVQLNLLVVTEHNILRIHTPPIFGLTMET
jgi:hypothetical protein